MNQQTKNNIVNAILVILVVGMVFYLVYYTRTEGYNCQSSPFTYAVRTLSTSGNNEVTCSCSFPASTQVLVFNKDNITLTSFLNMSLNIPA